MKMQVKIGAVIMKNLPILEVKLSDEPCLTLYISKLQDDSVYRGLVIFDKSETKEIMKKIKEFGGGK